MDQERRIAGKSGKLNLTVLPDSRHRLYIEQPWKLFGPVRSPGLFGIKDSSEEPAYFLGNSTAGILEGDFLQAKIELKRGAKIQLIAPSATRVFSMRNGEAGQRVEFDLEPDTRLLYYGNQLIPYRDANFFQNTDYRLQGNASLAAMEFFVPGRIAKGEIFAFGRVKIRSRIFLDGRMILDDRMHVEGGEEEIFLRPGIIPSKNHLIIGTFYLAGRLANNARLEHGLYGGYLSFTQPVPELIVGRALAPNVQTAETLFVQAIKGILA